MLLVYRWCLWVRCVPNCQSASISHCSILLVRGVDQRSKTWCTSTKRSSQQWATSLCLGILFIHSATKQLPTKVDYWRPADLFAPSFRTVGHQHLGHKTVWVWCHESWVTSFMIILANFIPPWSLSMVYEWSDNNMNDMNVASSARLCCNGLRRARCPVEFGMSPKSGWTERVASFTTARRLQLASPHFKRHPAFWGEKTFVVWFSAPSMKMEDSLGKYIIYE